MDANNPVVKLCIAGMQAEAANNMRAAHELFLQAWAARQDSFDACVAAHYVARHQADPAATLAWNQIALQHAADLADEQVRDFYPSLYLNLGWSYEQLGNWAEASRYYQLAEASIRELPAGSYGLQLRSGIENGLQRVEHATSMMVDN